MLSSFYPSSPKSSSPLPRPLRAIVEIRGAELVIYPDADSDGEEKVILDALRFVIKDGAGR